MSYGPKCSSRTLSGCQRKNPGPQESGGKFTEATIKYISLDARSARGADAKKAPASIGSDRGEVLRVTR
jgi:hypothetical protein